MIELKNSIGYRINSIFTHYNTELRKYFDTISDLYENFSEKIERYENLSKQDKYQVAEKNISIKMRSAPEVNGYRVIEFVDENQTSIMKSFRDLLSEEERENKTKRERKSPIKKKKELFQPFFKIILSNEEVEIWEAKHDHDLYKNKIDSFIESPIIYFFTFFEAFNKDIVKEILNFNLKILKSTEKTFSYEDIIKFDTIEELREYVIQKKVDQVGSNLDDFLDYLKKKVKIDITKMNNQWEKLKENILRRNILVHNSGKISSLYALKTNTHKKKIGKKLKITYKYIEESFENINDYMYTINYQIIRKLDNTNTFLRYIYSKFYLFKEKTWENFYNDIVEGNQKYTFHF